MMNRRISNGRIRRAAGEDLFPIRSTTLPVTRYSPGTLSSPEGEGFPPP